MTDSSEPLKLPKIAIRSSSNYAQSPVPLTNLNTDKSHSEFIPLSAAPQLPANEILVILTILNNLIAAIESIPLIIHLVENFEFFPISKFGSGSLDFQTLNRCFKTSTLDFSNNDVATAIAMQHARNALHFISHNKLKFRTKRVESANCPTQCSLRASASLMDVLCGFRKFYELVSRALSVTAEESHDLDAKLQQTKLNIIKFTAQTKTLKSEIKKTLEFKNHQTEKRDAKIRILNADIETFVCQSADRLQALRQEQLAAIQQANNYNLQREWIMHRKIKEISVEMRALRRANSDTEYLLRQRANDSEELVAELLKQYDTTMGLAKVTLSDVDYELQEEIRSLQHLETKAQQLEEELNQIVKEREMEEERRQQRVQKLKQRFRLIAKIHAYFCKQQKPVAAGSKSPKKRSVNKKV